MGCPSPAVDPEAVLAGWDEGEGNVVPEELGDAELRCSMAKLPVLPFLGSDLGLPELRGNGQSWLHPHGDRA